MYEALTDAELVAMRDRAYWEAAREVHEARAAKRDGLDALVVEMLGNSAKSASDFWASLRDAAQARGL